MNPAIVPKSDQLNSDDLIGGPRTIAITNVTVKDTGEQRVSIHFEGDNGKPWKPCKSMCRVLVALWGSDGKKYVGRRLTLFRDPSVKWAGMAVGGIRISEMSDIDKPMTLALTETRGKRAPFVVKPLTASKGDQKTVDPLLAAFSKRGVTREMIEGRIGHSVDAITEADLADLRGIFSRMKDGAEACHFFTAPASDSDSDAKPAEDLAAEAEAKDFEDRITEAAGDEQALAGLSSDLGKAKTRLGKHYKRLIDLHARAAK